MTRTWWFLLAALVIAVSVGAALLLWPRDGATSTQAADCGVVAALVPEFSEMDGQDQTGGENAARFAAQIRSDAASVSDVEVKEALQAWADGFARLSELQKPGSSGLEANAQIMQAAQDVYGQADELRRHCPDAWPQR